MYLNYFAVQKKLTHCKSTILQKTKIKKYVYTHTQCLLWQHIYHTHTHTVEYSSAIKKNEILPFVTDNMTELGGYYAQ